MNQPAFDTLRFAERLEKVGVPREQASEFSKTLGDFMQERLATKEDLEKLVTKKELKEEMLVTKKELKEEMKEIRSEMKWLCGVTISVLTLFMGAFKLFH
jgi:uncharacterized membrane protein YheB (UPF0754 family)